MPLVADTIHEKAESTLHAVYNCTTFDGAAALIVGLVHEERLAQARRDAEIALEAAIKLKSTSNNHDPRTAFEAGAHAQRRATAAAIRTGAGLESISNRSS